MCRCITSSSTPIPVRPFAALIRVSAVGVPDEPAWGSGTATPAPASRRRRPGSGARRSVASRSWPVRYPNGVPRPRRRRIGRKSRKTSADGGIARLAARARCSVPVSRASRMDSGPRRGTDWPAWKPGSGRPATTTRSGRGISIRPTCRRRRCCRSTPPGSGRSRSTTRSTGCRPPRRSTAGSRRRRRRSASR